MSSTNSTGFEYLDTAGAVDSFMAGIRDARDIALDTEGASFHRFVDRIYLLQLSTFERHAIIDPLSAGKLDSLGKLAEDSAVQIVFHDADYDLRLLRQDYGWHVTNIFDTRIAAQLLGYTSFGLAALLERFFGVKLDKKHQRADWSMRPLTHDMLDYAAQDTRRLLQLRDILSAELEKKGRLEWAREEFRRLESTEWGAEDPADAFMKIKGARDLTRRELAILRELAPWRDQVAAKADRAVFRVLGNEQLMEIARSNPKTRDDLARIKGMPRGVLDSRAQEMLDAVTRGLDVPERELPKYPRGKRWDKDPDFDSRVSAVKTARDAAAVRLELDPGVLCARERMEAVARRNPASPAELQEVVELRNWQKQELGPSFIAALGPHQSSPYKPM